ncbi:MAG: hypothetical protein HY301_12400 [Verrucomicrobia bacterium]|nr:hypothetical protein [Verrucomicrobiota bacterium]
MNFFSPARLSLAALLFLGTMAAVNIATADQIFSGPQPGEKTTSFKSLELREANAGHERDLIAELKGAPTVLVFVHGVERSMVPLMTVIDEYGKERAAKLRTEFVFLSADRLASQQKLPVVAGSLKLVAPISLSVDGAEGPGNYGLNKECLLTIVVAKENKVTANFALVQPGITDAPKVLAALAKVIGDDNPPTAEALREKRGVGGTMTKRGEAMKKKSESPGAPKVELPGAAPTDENLMGLLRRFIQKSNDDATVDKVLAEVLDYIKGNDDLTKQTINGWIRVIHLKYGTEHAQKAGQAMVDKLKK